MQDRVLRRCKAQVVTLVEEGKKLLERERVATGELEQLRELTGQAPKKAPLSPTTPSIFENPRTF